jgi:hypothetical protein
MVVIMNVPSRCPGECAGEAPFGIDVSITGGGPHSIPEECLKLAEDF